MKKEVDFQDKNYQKMLFIGICLVLLAMIATYYAVEFANNRQGNASPGDFLLDNSPNLDLFILRILLPLISFVLAGYLMLTHKKILPKALISIGLMYFVRAIFISVTYIGAHAQKTTLNQAFSIFSDLPYKGNDLFFSGHVAFPFMIALLFWEQKKVRYVFIALSILSGIVTIISKAHYTIDVLAAPFIVYGIYKITEKLLF